jgi:cytochrome c-type biogenesis protein CcmE
MSSKAVKILLTIFVALGGVAFLAYQSIGDVEYYVHVEDVVANPAKWVGKKTIQVHGYAHNVPAEGKMVGQNIYRSFQLESKGKTISVTHEGVVPDIFKEEAETVVKGSLAKQGDGTLLLTTVGGEQGIMAKCPSKYAGKQ